MFLVDTYLLLESAISRISPQWVPRSSLSCGKGFLLFHMHQNGFHTLILKLFELSVGYCDEVSLLFVSFNAFFLAFILVVWTGVLWQAALFSLLPPHLLKISEATKLTANALSPLASWVYAKFYPFNYSSRISCWLLLFIVLITFCSSISISM